MRALVVYESMYGNTHKIAEAIAEGLATGAEVTAIAVAEVAPDDIAAADLLVIGGPTHGWSMSRPSTRRGAVDAVGKPGRHLAVEEHAQDTGLREWIAQLGPGQPSKTAATFDTRRHAPLGLSGSAARSAQKRLVKLGWKVPGRPQGFFVSKDDQLEAGEIERARKWGERLGAAS